MCAIAGMVSLGATEVQEDVVTEMGRKMVHRGPDGHGTWSSADRRCAITHRRLSIIDLSKASNQPMTYDGLTITFNGEIYNFRELRERLVGQGYSFQSTGDTEVLLKAIHCWGDEAFSLVRGMFALGVYNERTAKLTLARDPAGEKPLYFSKEGGKFVFSSEIGPMLDVARVPRRANLGAIYYYLMHGYTPKDQSGIDAIQKLPPGSCLTLDCRTGACSFRSYWTQRSFPSPLVDGSFDVNSFVERLHDLMRQSIGRMLVADVPVGVLLSGGLDSSIITAIAAEMKPGLRTFTIGVPNGGQLDESGIAREVARHFGTQHTELSLDSSSLDNVNQLTALFGDPFADHSLVPTHAVCGLIRQHVTVALGGDGGDELFAGYLHHINRYARRQRFAPSIFRNAIRPLLERLPLGFRGRSELLGYARTLRRSTVMDSFFPPSSFSNILKGGVNTSLVDSALSARVGLWDSERSYVDNFCRTDFDTYLPDDILCKVDTMSMAASLEVRAPWLDRDVVEFALHVVPDGMKSDGCRNKILLQALAKKILPSWFNSERKQGFSIPMNRWISSPAAGIIRILREAPCPLLNPLYINRLVREQERGYSHSNRLFALAVISWWWIQKKIHL